MFTLLASLLLVKNAFGDGNGRHGLWPTCIKREMGNHLFEFCLRQAIVFCSHQMTRELFGVSSYDQSGNGNQAPISFREFWSLPDVAKKHVVRERHHFWQKGTNELLSRGLFLRLRHLLSFFIEHPYTRSLLAFFLKKSPAYALQ